MEKSLNRGYIVRFEHRFPLTEIHADLQKVYGNGALKYASRYNMTVPSQTARIIAAAIVYLPRHHIQIPDETLVPATSSYFENKSLSLSFSLASSLAFSLTLTLAFSLILTLAFSLSFSLAFTLTLSFSLIFTLTLTLALAFRTKTLIPTTSSYFENKSLTSDAKDEKNFFFFKFANHFGAIVCHKNFF